MEDYKCFLHYSKVSFNSSERNRLLLSFILFLPYGLYGVHQAFPYSLGKKASW